MNKKQALQELDKLFEIGFSYITVKGLITKIFDSMDSQSSNSNLLIPNKGGNTPITTPSINNSNPQLKNFSKLNEKLIVNYDDDLFIEIIKRSDIEGYNVDSSTKITISSTEYGKLFYYIKSDKVHVTKSNDWKNFGFNWLYKNIKNG